MGELRKVGESQYDVLVDGQVIGQVWNWHGPWSVQVGEKAYHGLKSRKEAIARVENARRLRQ